MKVIILSGKANKALSWLTNGNAVGSLQLVSKPVLNFTLEALQEQLNINCFDVLGDSRSPSLITKVSEYMQWGVSIQEYKNDSADNSGEVLWLRDDVLYDINFIDLLEKARQSDAKSLVFCSNKKAVAFFQKNNGWHEPSVHFSNTNSTDDFCHTFLDTGLWHREEMASGACYMIDSIESFHRYSMDLLNGYFRHFVLDHHQQGLRLVKGMQVNVESTSQQQRHAYLGDSVYIHPDSRIHEQVVLCEQSYVDSYVDISDSIIMPGVYIGSYLNIKNSIVTSNSVIQVDTGNVLPIVDKTMLADILLRAG